MKKEIMNQNVKDNLFKTDLIKLLCDNIEKDQDYFRKLIIANEYISQQLLLFKNDTIINEEREEN